MAKTTGQPIEVTDKLKAKAATKTQAVAYVEVKIKDKAKTDKAKSKGTVVEIVCEVHGVTVTQYAAGMK